MGKFHRFIWPEIETWDESKVGSANPDLTEYWLFILGVFILFVDRFCILGPVEAQLERLHALADLGVDQFAIYLQHDGKDHTLTQYGEHVIPALREQALARS